MLVVVLLTLHRTCVADASAKFEHFAENFFVRAGSAKADAAGGVANIGAVHAGANALRHVHLLGRAGIRAAEAHLRAVHQVVNYVAERLVHMAMHVWVQRDHFADGHSGLPEFLWRTSDE